MGTDLSKLLGAAHAMELFFVFGLTDMGFANRFLFADPESAEELSLAMRSYWTNFAYTGAPARGRDGDLPEWPAWKAAADAPKYLVFDTPVPAGIRTGDDFVDQGTVLAKIQSDSRLEDGEERCRVLRILVHWSEALSPEAYAAIDACAAYPLERRSDFASLPE